MKSIAEILRKYPEFAQTKFTPDEDHCTKVFYENNGKHCFGIQCTDCALFKNELPSWVSEDMIHEWTPPEHQTQYYLDEKPRKLFSGRKYYDKWSK